MSTDMIQFAKANVGPFGSLFSVGALGLYLLISLPLVIITLSGWYLFYRWELRHRNRAASTDKPSLRRRGWVSARRFIHGSYLSILPK